MIYRNHGVVRGDREDSSVWPEDEASPEFKKVFNKLRKSHPVIPYTIEVECNSCWGGFEREFIAYSLGILDDVQMRIRHSEEQLSMFWEEVFNKEPIKFDEALESYELLRDYLLETFHDVDDWYQLTFYNIDWNAYHREKRYILKIQLAKPLSNYWENLIISRMKKFFIDKPYEYINKDVELTDIRLCDRKGNIVKEYLTGDRT